MEAISQSKLTKSIEEVRGLLQPALFQLQELEKETEEPVRAQVMDLSTRLAEVVGGLFKAGRQDNDPDLDVTATVRRSYLDLEQIRRHMDDLPGTEEERRNVSQALAMLFALGGGPRSSCPPPRRSSTNMRAVRIPDPTTKSKTGASSPSIELGEIDAAALGLDLDLDGELPPSSRDPAKVDGGDASPSEEAPASERRSSPRIAFEVDVGFVSESHFYAGISMDVSDGGLFVATYRLQPVGSHVAVTFVLPNGYAITTDAVVRWVREESEDASPGMGLAFDLKGEDQKQVCDFCERRQPLFIDMD